MPSAPLSLLRQLSANSDPYRDPLAVLKWQSLSTAEYWLPRSALSLTGVAEFEIMDEATRIRLSQYEFIGNIQAGLSLEGIFLERLSRSLKHGLTTEEYEFMLHELREEAGHSLMFLQLIKRSGLPLPSLRGRYPRLAEFMGRHAPEDGLLFWLALVIGEEIPDRLNRYIRLDSATALNLLIRQMCTLHVVDEARHIAYARRAFETRAGQASRLHKAMLRPLANRIFRQFVEMVYHPRAELYELAGLRPGARWRALALASAPRREFIRKLVSPTARLLGEHGFQVTVA